MEFYGCCRKNSIVNWINDGLEFSPHLPAAMVIGFLECADSDSELEFLQKTPRFNIFNMIF